MSWAEEILAPTLARIAREQEAAERHRAECTDRPCERCARFVCQCGAPVDGRRRCDECQRGEFLLRLDVPKRFRWALVASPSELAPRVQTSVGAIAQLLAAPPESDVVLLGQAGTGKTSLAVAMLHAWVSADVFRVDRVYFVEAWRLSGARARHELGKGEAPMVHDAMACDLLVLDDLGAERDDRNNALNDVIMHRHAEGLPTWTTTGFEPAQILERYGTGVGRRLFEQAKLVRLGAKP